MTDNDDGIGTKRFEFLSLLIKKGPTSIGGDMYEMGRQLGLSEQLVRDIVNYYHYRDVIQFPILGPYIKLVYDWLNVLDSRDRARLREGFLLKLRDLQSRIRDRAVKATDVFEAMEFGAYSDSLIPAIVESLVSDRFVRKVGGCVKLSRRGQEECERIEARRAKEYQETMRRLRYQ
jgi:hypothetical protein